MRVLLIFLSYLTFTAMAHSQVITCVDFENDSVNTYFDIETYSDGDTFMTNNGIVQRLFFKEYLDTTGWGAINPPGAVIWNINDHPYGPFDGNYMWFANCDVELDLSDLPNVNQVVFQISSQEIDTVDGAYFSVNGYPSMFDSVVNYIGNWVSGVDLDFVPDSLGGTVTLTGNIQTVRLGGFEFGYDDFCVSHDSIIDTTSSLNLNHIEQNENELWIDYSQLSIIKLRYILSDNGPAEVQVYDLHGHEFFREKVSGNGSFTISIFDLPAGIHIVRLIQGDSILSNRIVIP